MQIIKKQYNDEQGYNLSFEIQEKNISMNLFIVYDTIFLIDLKAKFKEFEKNFLAKIYGNPIRKQLYLQTDNWLSTNEESIKQYNLAEIKNISIIFDTYLEFSKKVKELEKMKNIILLNNLILINNNIMFSEEFSLKINRIIYLIKNHQFDKSADLFKELTNNINEELSVLFSNSINILNLSENNLKFTEDTCDKYLNLFLNNFINDYNLKDLSDFLVMINEFLILKQDQHSLFLKSNPEYVKINNTIEILKNMINKYNVIDFDKFKNLDYDNVVEFGKNLFILCDNYSIFFNIPQYSVRNDSVLVNHSITTYGNFPTLSSNNKMNYNLTNILNQITHKLLNYFNDLNNIKDKYFLLKEIEDNILIFNKTKIFEIYFYLVQYLDILRYTTAQLQK